MKNLYLLAFALILVSCNSYQKSENPSDPVQTLETLTLLGDTLYSPEIEAGKAFDQFKAAQINYFDDENNAEALIWYSRRTAYLGYYRGKPSNYIL